MLEWTVIGWCYQVLYSGKLYQFECLGRLECWGRLYDDECTSTSFTPLFASLDMGANSKNQRRGLDRRNRYLVALS